jgi:3-hydroxypropanoate dehydrogenase
MEFYKMISEESLDQIFFKARTHRSFAPEPIEDRILQQIYDTLKWGPTSANCCPMRLTFVKSEGSKEKLIACLDKGNIEKVKSAPVTAIIAQDMEFYEKLPKLAPQGDLRSYFAGKTKLIADTAFRNSSLQGAYFIIAARALGLDCGPMSGFDNEKLDAAFFAGTKLKSNFICNLGRGDATKLHPRQPRLNFEEACEIV